MFLKFYVPFEFYQNLKQRPRLEHFLVDRDWLINNVRCPQRLLITMRGPCYLSRGQWAIIIDYWVNRWVSTCTVVRHIIVINNKLSWIVRNNLTGKYKYFYQLYLQKHQMIRVYDNPLFESGAHEGICLHRVVVV